MADTRKTIFVIRFADGEYVPNGWVKKFPVDAAAEVRNWLKDRRLEVTEFEIHGLACLMKRSEDGKTFYKRWQRQLEEEEAKARAEERAKKQ